MFTGPIEELGRLAENIGRLADVPSQLAPDVATDIEALIAEQFASESDPYGDGWEAHEESTVARWGEHDILDLSGIMRSTITVQPMGGAGVSITFDAPYVGYHHSGTRHMVARPVLPLAEFPASWEEAIQARAEEKFGDTLAR